jgi:hypothetical protein
VGAAHRERAGAVRGQQPDRCGPDVQRSFGGGGSGRRAARAPRASASCSGGQGALQGHRDLTSSAVQRLDATGASDARVHAARRSGGMDRRPRISRARPRLHGAARRRRHAFFGVLGT